MKRALLLIAISACSVACGHDDETVGADVAAETQTDATKTPFAAQLTKVATLAATPRDSVFGFTTTTFNWASAGRDIPYFGDCTSTVGCVEVLDINTRKVRDVSKLGVNMHQEPSWREPFWSISPNRTSLLFRKTGPDGKHADKTAFIIPFMAANDPSKAIALPPSLTAAWLTDDLLVMTDEGLGRIVEAKTGKTKAEITIAGSTIMPDWYATPDHGTVLFGNAAGAKLVRLDDGSSIDVTDWDTQFTRRVAVDPKGKGFVVASGQDGPKKLSLIGLDGKSTLIDGETLGTATFAPDGRLAYAKLKSIVIRSAMAGTPDVVLDGLDWPALITPPNLSFSADGKWIDVRFGQDDDIAFGKTEASGKITMVVPYSDVGTTSKQTVLPDHRRAIISVMGTDTVKPSVFLLDFTAGTRKLLAQNEALDSDRVYIEPGSDEPHLAVRIGPLVKVIDLDVKTLATLSDPGEVIEWRDGWLYYGAPRPNEYALHGGVHALSRDGKIDSLIMSGINEALLVNSPGSATRMLLRADRTVFAFDPKTYDPAAPLPKPATPGTASPTTSDPGDDNSSATPTESPSDSSSETSPNKSRTSPNGDAAETNGETEPTTPPTKPRATVGCSTLPGTAGGNPMLVIVAMFGVALAKRRRTAMGHDLGVVISRRGTSPTRNRSSRGRPPYSPPARR